MRQQIEAGSRWLRDCGCGCGCCICRRITHSLYRISKNCFCFYCQRHWQRHKLLFLFSAYTNSEWGGEGANLHKVSHAGTHTWTKRQTSWQALDRLSKIKTSLPTQTRTHTLSPLSMRQCTCRPSALSLSHTSTRAHSSSWASRGSVHSLSLCSSLRLSHNFGCCCY